MDVCLSQLTLLSTEGGDGVRLYRLQQALACWAHRGGTTSLPWPVRALRNFIQFFLVAALAACN